MVQKVGLILGWNAEKSPEIAFGLVGLPLRAWKLKTVVTMSLHSPRKLPCLFGHPTWGTAFSAGVLGNETDCCSLFQATHCFLKILLREVWEVYISPPKGNGKGLHVAGSDNQICRQHMQQRRWSSG